jgi:hypothetical protein
VQWYNLPNNGSLLPKLEMEVTSPHVEAAKHRHPGRSITDTPYVPLDGVSLLKGPERRAWAFLQPFTGNGSWAGRKTVNNQSILYKYLLIKMTENSRNNHRGDKSLSLMKWMKSKSYYGFAFRASSSTETWTQWRFYNGPRSLISWSYTSDDVSIQVKNSWAGRKTIDNQSINLEVVLDKGIH